MESEPLRRRFGINVHPGVDREDEAFARARIADEHGLDFISLMDHPYNHELYDTWTLLTALAMRTERVHLLTNVLNTLLRPPAMLAKAAATLDRLSNGRLELGVGAGAYVDGVAGFGGPTGSPGERYQAFKESLEIIRGLWDSGGEPFSFDGTAHRLTNATFGPIPTRAIPIWIGAGGPRMLRLTGRLGDGILVSAPYVPPEQLPEVHRLIDEGAAQAGRPPTAIRRGYNLMGLLDTGAGGRIRARPGLIAGDVDHWVQTIERFARDNRMDTFTFWPVAGDELRQVEVFATEVVPSLRARWMA
ncbi:MAG TPA: LLM class flavin-dependent oxidoreductase [Thermomicrobiales bacterium]|nr:LLM class flavin-dependent oxidoreductase [Thermomicrobiales bacterium]